MASSSFRDSMNSLGWARREEAVNTSKPSGVYGTLQKLNPFGNEGNLRLPVHEEASAGAPLPARTRREEEEGWFARKSHIPCSLSSTRQSGSQSIACLVSCAKKYDHRIIQYSKRGMHLWALRATPAGEPACSDRQTLCKTLPRTCVHVRLAERSR